jgi:hypothetical protein
LNVERDIAHDPNSKFAVLPWCYGLNAHDVRKVPTAPQGASIGAHAIAANGCPRAARVREKNAGASQSHGGHY